MTKKLKSKQLLFFFDDRYEEVYSRVPVEQTPELNEKVYYTRGMTAYFDAVGKSISKFDGKKNVIFFIETDGHENASKEYDAASIKSLVEKKKKHGWDFNFVGADLDAATVQKLSATMGIDAGKAMAFDKSGAGYATRNATFLSAITSYIDDEE